MPRLYPFLRLLALLFLALSGAGRARAQGENNNWTFSFLLGLAFQPSGPVYTRSSINSFESTSTISDAAGNLLFYTNGTTIWDRQHQPMTNACASCDGARSVLFGHDSSTQGVLIVKKPGSESLYYVFATDAQENLFARGLTYSEVDMTLRGGLGGVTAVRNVRLPAPTLSNIVTEGVVGMQHANRRDVWVVVHGQDTNAFYSFLVTANGINPVPVASATGAPATRLSTMKFSPSGRHLARCGAVFAPVELFDFDPATGVLSNQQILSPLNSGWMTDDVEFSSDGTKLYQQQSFFASGSTLPTLQQYDLQAGTTADIIASKQQIATLIFRSWLELGPNGSLYVSLGSTGGVVDRPNRRGSAVNYRPAGLPNAGNGVWAMQNIVRLQPPPLDFMAEMACAGSTVEFRPYDIPAGTGPLTWTFHDPVTGATDSVQAPTTTRFYPTAGTFTATLSTTVRGQRYQQRRYVVIAPLPVSGLPTEPVALCLGSTLLQLREQPVGTSIRWSDGSQGKVLQVREPGRYWVELRNYQGCVRVDTAVVTPCMLPNIITPDGDPTNEAFRLVGLPAGVWDLEVFNRWGRLVYRQSRYDNRWNAPGQPAGTYYYVLTHPVSGQRLKGHLEVQR